MAAYVARRLASLLAVLVGVSLLAFFLGAFAPGDPAEMVLQRELGHPPTAEQLQAKRVELGLDRPLPAQYAAWLSGAVRGDLGRSWGTGQGVFDLLKDRLPRTAILGFAALALAIVVALPLGIAAAYRQNSAVDHGSRIAALLGASVPNYLLGYVLMFVFGVQLGLLPVFGFGSASHLVLPVVTLGTAAAAILTRLTRSSVLEVLGEDYMRTARAKGLSGKAVLLRHAVRNAWNPIFSVIGLYVGHLLSGAVIVEWIFAWPGLGKLAVDAIQARDYPVVQGFVLFTGVVYVLANLLTDLTYAWLDPRVRLHAAAQRP